MEVKFVSFDKQFLDVSYKWLQNEELRQLIAAKSITKEEQIAWFEKLPSRSDYFIWGIMYNNLPVGVCGLKNVIENSGEYWGYIGDEKYRGKGIGSKMMSFIETVADNKNLKEIYLRVLHTNEAAIRLYSKSGYTIISEEAGFISMRKVIQYV